jgi:hypothetical protein
MQILHATSGHTCNFLSRLATNCMQIEHRWSPHACNICQNGLLLVYLQTDRTEYIEMSHIRNKWGNCLYVRCSFSNLTLNCFKIWNRPLCMLVAATWARLSCNKNLNKKIKTQQKSLKFYKTLVPAQAYSKRQSAGCSKLMRRYLQCGSGSGF